MRYFLLNLKYFFNGGGNNNDDNNNVLERPGTTVMFQNPMYFIQRNVYKVNNNKLNSIYVFSYLTNALSTISENYIKD